MDGTQINQDTPTKFTTELIEDIILNNYWADLSPVCIISG